MYRLQEGWQSSVTLWKKLWEVLVAQHCWRLASHLTITLWTWTVPWECMQVCYSWLLYLSTFISAPFNDMQTLTFKTVAVSTAINQLNRPLRKLKCLHGSVGSKGHMQTLWLAHFDPLCRFAVNWSVGHNVWLMGVKHASLLLVGFNFEVESSQVMLFKGTAIMSIDYVVI